jgi:hypothetical protein
VRHHKATQKEKEIDAKYARPTNGKCACGKKKMLKWKNITAIEAMPRMPSNDRMRLVWLILSQYRPLLI